ncbi:5-formyltetrahydrofolate cyclo-ligase [Vibrio sp. UCD-FRSSP16_10]|uniref:5-formyltetrahydrofolate cyclo-ligase n=1 Tax=unclassified Vibrio TaxID=2614977 RepID=UPI0008015976|nr:MULTISPECIES: 5-formyltetrahydrofolate cyclo-ligase [unclassified Vibrio]OBT17356.1 5-formyltetrahydrofolate cyclo-ligase [Vibrio sp. UCD-FRSSP16_30]OBT23125.1 5-formyltetrahydrofolate cyclo-ligase [Vibrio sp. UCD-FRSSP16_10]
MQSLLTRNEIRKHVRTLRTNLSTSQQQNASSQLVKQFSQLPELKYAKNVALYLTNDGELDPALAINWCWQNQINTYIPVLHPFSKGQLLFIQLSKNSQLTANKYGILEPKLSVKDIIPAAQLDVIFTPLVAFDSCGQRLGMGGGYYDRTLAPFINSPTPKPIGIAHDCQQFSQLPTQEWDIPLDKIITPSKTWDWSSAT